MSPLHIGQQVVCIVDTSGWGGFYGEILPVKGPVYTVRTIEPYYNGIAIRLNEIVNELHLYCCGVAEIQFDSKAFRPVVETNISIFTAMLAPDKVPALVLRSSERSVAG